MLRAGARHPDADYLEASTSRHQHQDEPDAMYATLNEYLQMEHKFQPRLCLPADSENGEVTIGARDGAAHVLRCLKVWFDLPADILISAINLFDRFLTKMKVRPCHIPCITVSCMNIAIDQYAEDTHQPRKVSIEELVSVSQSACTSRDVARMSRVIADKLALAAATRAVCALRWMRLLRRLLDTAACQLNIDLKPVQENELVNLLEIAVCDASCINARTSELALVIIYHKLEEQLMEWSNRVTAEGGSTEPAYFLNDYAAQLQAHCNMSESSLSQVRALVRAAKSRYGGRGRAHPQRLVWRLSERTLKVLRPTDRLTSLLPTIEEQNFAVEQTPTRNRTGSESSESEETSDWPRSPVLPVYCNN